MLPQISIKYYLKTEYFLLILSIMEFTIHTMRLCLSWRMRSFILLMNYENFSAVLIYMHRIHRGRLSLSWIINDYSNRILVRKSFHPNHKLIRRFKNQRARQTRSTEFRLKAFSFSRQRKHRDSNHLNEYLQKWVTIVSEQQTNTEIIIQNDFKLGDTKIIFIEKISF